VLGGAVFAHLSLFVATGALVATALCGAAFARLFVRGTASPTLLCAGAGRLAAAARDTGCAKAGALPERDLGRSPPASSLPRVWRVVLRLSPGAGSNGFFAAGLVFAFAAGLPARKVPCLA